MLTECKYRCGGNSYSMFVEKLSETKVKVYSLSYELNGTKAINRKNVEHIFEFPETVWRILILSVLFNSKTKLIHEF